MTGQLVKHMIKETDPGLVVICTCPIKIEVYGDLGLGSVAGNSGGALVDSYGNLLGVNTAILNQSGSAGISFAIPADTAAKVLKDIISYGYVVRGWVGMEAFPLTPQIAKRLNLNISNGLLVRAIYNSSPAHLAGIQPGDIVIAINGEPVSDRQTSVNQIADVAPGTPIELEIWRQGETFSVTAVAGIRPTNSGN